MGWSVQRDTLADLQRNVRNYATENRLFRLSNMESRNFPVRSVVSKMETIAAVGKYYSEGAYKA